MRINEYHYGGPQLGDIVKLLLAHALTKRRWKDCAGKTSHGIAKDRGHGYVKKLLRDF